MLLWLGLAAFCIPLIYAITAGRKAKRDHARELELVQRKIAEKERQAASLGNASEGSLSYQSSNKGDIYAAPAADLETSSASVQEKDGALARFGLSYLWGFIVILPLATYGHGQFSFVLTLGIAVLAIISGSIAIAIPLRSRFLYVGISVVLAIVLTVTVIDPLFS